MDIHDLVKLYQTSDDDTRKGMRAMVDEEVKKRKDLPTNDPSNRCGNHGIHHAKPYGP